MKLRLLEAKLRICSIEASSLKHEASYPVIEQV